MNTVHPEFVEKNLARNRIHQLLSLLARIGADPRDGDELRLQKTLLILGSLRFIAAGALWGLLYFSFGESLAAAIPLGYVFVSCAANRSNRKLSC
jgi:hypothetical protein